MDRLAELRTSRLLLLRPRADDFDGLDRMHRDPQVMATLGGIRTPEQTRQFINGLLAHWEQHGFGLWMARDAATSRFVGRGGLRHTVVEGKPDVEVAYGLMPEFWGRGLATELARESVRVGFVDLQ